MAKILVVDDDPDMVLAARLCLERAGHQVVEAKNGDEGLAKVKSDEPDLIILDVMMNTTTEGFQVAHKLRSPDPKSEYAVYKDIPIVLLTAIHSTSPVRLAPEKDYLPVDAFIDKPIDPDKLVEEVEKLIKK
ncbi:MAG: response regulator [Anaerolineae bacterium]|nr:response regulator [Anaerolineae bacterium]